MDFAASLLAIAGGFVALIFGGELLVRSASAFATIAKIPPLVIGLTVVAFGTSAPELAVVVQSAFVNKTDLAIGNAVGSNIFNVLFVLGLSALISPLIVSSRLVRLDVPLMIGASILMLILGLDGCLGRLDGVLLFGLLLVFIVWTIMASRNTNHAVTETFNKDRVGFPRYLAIQSAVFVAGMLLLVSGAHFAVDGAVHIATVLGVSELIVGLTIIAVGTSLPEVVTSVVASYRGQRDIAVGNVVGSNLFNILGVLGLGSIVSPSGLNVSQNAITFDIPVMIAVAVACLPIFLIGHRIDRWEGGLLFGYYGIYVTYLILDASGHGFGDVLGVVLILFVIPLTVITMAIGVYRHWRRLRDGEVSQV